MFSLARTIKPPLRALKYSWLHWNTQLKIINPWQQVTKKERDFAFIIGCGRSGTTVLGSIFSTHPQISYLFEPYHLWAGVDRRTDVLNLYYKLDSALLMDASFVNSETQLRFERLISSLARKDPSIKLLLEKTPLNAMRIPYLRALSPKAKFIHLVRDGVDVCHSIAKLAIGNSYKISGKPLLNQWWGVNNAKWLALARDGMNAGYYVDEAPCLNQDLAKAAYEWLVSLGEVDRWRTSLGNSLYELTYSSLISEPISNLKNLCEFLELDAPLSWLEKSQSRINTAKSERQLTLSLPPLMCQTFNNYQQYYGFCQKAINWSRVDEETIS